MNGTQQQTLITIGATRAPLSCGGTFCSLPPQDSMYVSVEREGGDEPLYLHAVNNGTVYEASGLLNSGDIVILAVLYSGAVSVVAHYGDALAGKILVDITNPFNADASGIVTTEGNSIAQQIAVVAPEDTHVVKAFNMLFRGVIAADKPVDVFFAGEDVPTLHQLADGDPLVDEKAPGDGDSSMSFWWRR